MIPEISGYVANTLTTTILSLLLIWSVPNRQKRSAEPFYSFAFYSRPVDTISHLVSQSVI